MEADASPARKTTAAATVGDPRTAPPQRAEVFLVACGEFDGRTRGRVRPGGAGAHAETDPSKTATRPASEN